MMSFPEVLPPFLPPPGAAALGPCPSPGCPVVTRAVAVLRLASSLKVFGSPAFRSPAVHGPTFGLSVLES